jgi:hypothetical protein
MSFRSIAVTCILLLTSTFAQGEDTPDALIGGNLGVYSRYVWRGIQFDDKPVLQTDLWMEVHGISAVFWGNMSLTDESDEFEGQFNEWDVYISFPVKSVEYLTLGGEIDYLSFPSSSGAQGASTAEVSAWISGNILTSPKLQVFWDVWQYHGLYANLSLSHGIEFGPGLLNMCGGIGWGNDEHNVQAGVPQAGGLLDMLVQATYIMPISEALSITPGINFSSILQGDIRDSYKAAEISTDNLFVSLNASILY